MSHLAKNTVFEQKLLYNHQRTPMCQYIDQLTTGIISVDINSYSEVYGWHERSKTTGRHYRMSNLHTECWFLGVVYMWGWHLMDWKLGDSLNPLSALIWDLVRFHRPYWISYLPCTILYKNADVSNKFLKDIAKLVKSTLCPMIA